MADEIGFDTAGNRVYAQDRPRLVQLHGLRHSSGKPLFLWVEPGHSRSASVVGYQADGTPLFDPAASGPAEEARGRTLSATVALRGQDAVVVIPRKR